MPPHLYRLRVTLAVCLILPIGLFALLGLDSVLRVICITSAAIFVIFVTGLLIRFVLYKTVLKKNTIQCSHYDCEEQLESYLKNHTSCDFLENGNIKLYFNKNGSIYNIKLINKENNNMYEIKHLSWDKKKTSTLWGFICMNFHDNLTYSGLIFWLDGFESLDIRNLKEMK